jgi:putative endonuclease
MGFYLYILFSTKLNKYYIGQTNDIKDRLRRHNAGLETYTSKGIPWEVKYYQKVDTRSESMRLEKKVKNLKSKSRIEEFIEKGIKEGRGCRGTE